MKVSQILDRNIILIWHNKAGFRCKYLFIITPYSEWAIIVNGGGALECVLYHNSICVCPKIP